MRNKVSIIGAGMTGSTAAHWLAERELADLILMDVVEGMPQGKALDLQEALPVIGKDVAVVGSNDFPSTAGSDIIVITAGLPRKPGMSRDDLLITNAGIVRNAVVESVKYSPDAIFVILTNPLDAMAYLAMKVANLPPNRVVGQAGILDSARMRAFVAMELGVSVEDISALLMGGHGDTMVPIPSCTSVGGIPVTNLIKPERLQEIIARTASGGAEIVSLLKTGSAYYAPAAATAQMVEAVVRDKRRLIPCAAYCDKEYGVGGYYVGVPIVLGASGVERIIELKLTTDEQTAFNKSVDAVKQLVAAMAKLV